MTSPLIMFPEKCFLYDLESRMCFPLYGMRVRPVFQQVNLMNKANQVNQVKQVNQVNQVNRLKQVNRMKQVN